MATERPSGEDRKACASKTISSGNDQSDVTVSFFVRESGSGKKPLVIFDNERFDKGFGSGTVSKRVQSENFTVELCLVQTWKGTDPRAIWYSDVRINVQEYIPTTPAPSTPASPPAPAPERDSDNDGIIDSHDHCVNTAEIFNGYQDTDGCPDMAPPTSEYPSPLEYRLLFGLGFFVFLPASIAFVIIVAIRRRKKRKSQRLDQENRKATFWDQREQRQREQEQYEQAQRKREKAKKRRQKETHYDVLGVSQDASQKAIKEAYRKLSLKWHPDKNKSPDATKHFNKIIEAYDVLKNKVNRKKYDESTFD